MTRLALFSLANPEHAIVPARMLADCGFSIVGSRETSEALRAEGIPSVDIAKFTGVAAQYPFPPTLHPKVEAALTVDGFSEPIEIVFDEPYDLEIGNDIGGHTLLALAVKGDRLPVMDLADMMEVARAIAATGSVGRGQADRLRRKAGARIAAHYSSVLAKIDGRSAFVSMIPVRQLASGENPYQQPAYLCLDVNGSDADGIGVANLRQVGGDTPCFTNLADLDNLLGILARAARGLGRLRGRAPFIVAAAKHGNVCGAAFDWSAPHRALERALWGSPVAVWGGEVATNFPVTDGMARLLFASPDRGARFGLSRWSLDVIAAPSFTRDAVRILGARKRTKMFAHAALARPDGLRLADGLRRVSGGFLIQPAADYIIDFDEITWADRPLAERERADAVLSWAAAYGCFFGGNEVALTRDGCLLGVGGGPSTVEAARIALWRARENGHESGGAIFAADAFLPFTDAARALVEGGCRGGIAPAGGMRQQDVVSVFSAAGLSFGMIPEAYRGFCRH